MKYYFLFPLLFVFAKLTFAQEPDPNKHIFVQEQPKPINMDEIRKKIGYPIVTKEAVFWGAIMLNVLVDEKGNYVRHIVSEGESSLLLEEIEKYINQLKFTPAMLNGKAIAFWLNVPFYFKAQ
jgi:outer membrane biosynthesis protein TonB